MQSSICYQSRSKPIKPISYNINNLQSVVNDITRRSQVFKLYQNIIDQKIKLQKQYVKQLKQIAAMLCVSPVELRQYIPTQFMLIKIYEQIKEEIRIRQKYLETIDNQLLQPMKITHLNRQIKIKPDIVLAKQYSKEFKQSAKQLQKSKIIYEQAIADTQSYKYDYITSFFTNDYSLNISQKTHSSFSSSSTSTISTTTMTKFSKLDQNIPLFKRTFQQNLQKYNKLLASHYKKTLTLVGQLSTYEKNMLKSQQKIFNDYQGHQMILATKLQTLKAKYLQSTNQIDLELEIQQIKHEQMLEIQLSLYTITNQQDKYLCKLYDQIISSSLIELQNYLEKNQQELQLFQYYFTKFQSEISAKMFNKKGQKQKSITSLNNVKLSMQTKQIIQIFVSLVYTKGNICPSRIKQNYLRLLQLFTHQFQRKDFIKCLEMFQKIEEIQLNDGKVQIIDKMLEIFLKSCLQNFDIYNAGKLINLRLKYIPKSEEVVKQRQVEHKKNQIQDNEDFFNSSSDISEIMSTKSVQKHSFIDTIKNNNIFRSILWWENLLLQRIYLAYTKLFKSKKQKKPSLSHILGLNTSTTRSTITSIPSSMRKNLIEVQKLTQILNTMRIFGIQYENINSFGLKFIQKLKLHQNERRQVQQSLPLHNSVSRIDQFSDTDSLHLSVKDEANSFHF